MATRSSTERALRYVMRRTPCMVILCVQVIFVMFLLVVAVIHYPVYIRLSNQLDYLTKIVQLMEHKKKHSHIWLNSSKCYYEAPPTNVSAYNLYLCERSTSFEPYAYWAHRTSPGNCPRLLSAVPCHKDTDRTNISLYQKAVSSCAGLFNARMPYVLYSVNRVTLAPRISAENMVHLSGRVILAADLFMRCPRCRVYSDYYTSETTSGNGTQGRCSRQLSTVKKGWPDIAEFCDREEILDSDVVSGVFCWKRYI